MASAAQRRLIDASHRIVELLAPDFWALGSLSDSLSPIAELALPSEHHDLLKNAARIARVVVDPPAPEVPPQDRSLVRLRPIPSSPPDACAIGAEHTSLGWEPVFICDRPEGQVGHLQREMLKCWATVLSPRLARPRTMVRSLGPWGPALTVAFDRITGLSLDRLAPMSPPMALGILAEARIGLDALHAQGMTHGSLKTKRVRITPAGRPVLCYGLDAARTTVYEDHAALAQIVLSTAFDDPLLLEILAGRDEGACTVACDRVVQMAPSLDDLAVGALRQDGSPDLIPGALARLLDPDEPAARLAEVLEAVGSYRFDGAR